MAQDIKTPGNGPYFLLETWLSRLFFLAFPGRARIIMLSESPVAKVR